MRSRNFDLSAFTILFMVIVLRNGQYENLYTIVYICLVFERDFDGTKEQKLEFQFNKWLEQTDGMTKWKHIKKTREARLRLNV